MGKKEKDDAAYRAGYESGRNSDFLDGIAQGFSRGTGGDRGRIYDKGYDQGARDKADYGPSESSGDSEDSDDGCYISTACVAARGLSDDCFELTILRDFRDTFLKNHPGGQAMIREYYEKAPMINSAIREEDESEIIYEQLYKHLIRRSVRLIKDGQPREALTNYQHVFEKLANKYL